VKETDGHAPRNNISVPASLSSVVKAHGFYGQAQDT